MNTDAPYVLPDDDPAGIAVQPLTHLCTSTQGGVVPPFLWHEYTKRQVGTTDDYAVTVNGASCTIGVGTTGEANARHCCLSYGFHPVTHTTAQIATYTPLAFLLVLFFGIGAYQKWRRDVNKALRKL